MLPGPHSRCHSLFFETPDSRGFSPPSSEHPLPRIMSSKSDGAAMRRGRAASPSRALSRQSSRDYSRAKLVGYRKSVGVPYSYKVDSVSHYRPSTRLGMTTRSMRK
jgi:hypothetical protein